MRKIAVSFTLLATVLVCLLPAVPAQAAAARTFVSAAGSDSNNCTNVATPCRHLAAAYAATAADGEIYVLDPANYGSLTITGPVSIEGHGWASIAPPGINSAAITINAPGATDKINIIGVVLDGTALAGTDGIIFYSGGSLTVRDSVIRNFGNAGIDYGPSASSHLFVSNDLVSDNGQYGIYINNGGSGTVDAVLDNVAIENNNFGLFLQRGSTAMVRNCTVADNGSGLYANNSLIRVTRSTITGSTTGWVGVNGGTVSSYADNNIDGNTSGNTAPPALIYK